MSLSLRRPLQAVPTPRAEERECRFWTCALCKGCACPPTAASRCPALTPRLWKVEEASHAPSGKFWPETSEVARVEAAFHSPHRCHAPRVSAKQPRGRTRATRLWKAVKRPTSNTSASSATTKPGGHQKLCST